MGSNVVNTHKPTSRREKRQYLLENEVQASNVMNGCMIQDQIIITTGQWIRIHIAPIVREVVTFCMCFLVGAVHELLQIVDANT